LESCCLEFFARIQLALVAATFKGASSRYLYRGFVVVLAALQVIVNFGPQPSSGEMVAILALAFYIALSLGAWIEHVATTTTGAGLAR
jgi:hypothetical protein